MAETIDPSVVEPAVGAVAPTEAPAVEPKDPNAAAAPTAAKGGGGLDDSIIRIPAMQALLSGSPPALSFDQGFTNREEAKTIQTNKDALLKAGIGFYRSLAGDHGVLFNQFYVHGTDLQAADKAGKLLAIAPPFDTINQEVSKSGDGNPVNKIQSIPGGFANPQSTGAPPQAAQGVSVPVSAQPTGSNSQTSKLIAQQVKNLQPGSPTSGPVPGAGRFLNAIQRPVI